MVIVWGSVPITNTPVTPLRVTALAEEREQLYILKNNF